MDILTFVPASETVPEMNWDRFCTYLDEEFHGLEKDKFAYRFETLDQSIVIQCKKFPTHLSVSEVVDTFRHFFSTALAEYIVEELEESLIHQMIKRDFGYRRVEDINPIYRYCQQLLFMQEGENIRDEVKIVQRKSRIFKQTYEYLGENSEFYLNGFFRFRLKEYQKELNDVIEYAIEEYILDIEYQEFIYLLQYFVTTQESKLPFLHVLHIQERQFLLYNENGEVVSEKEVEGYLKEYSIQSMNYEDLIISTLVTLAPKRMTLHTSEPNSTVIQTLKLVFQEQLNICTNCLHCVRWRSHIKA